MRKIFNLLILISLIIIAMLLADRFGVLPPKVKNYIQELTKGADQVSSNIEQMSKDNVENIVKEYLIENPDLIVSALENLQKKKLEESSVQANKYLKENLFDIENAGTPPSVGAADSDINTVLFYDYNCNYCKQAHQEIKKVIKDDSKVKFILRPIPILGEESLYAAQVAISLAKISPQNFEQMHDMMMDMKPVNEASVKEMLMKFDIEYKLLENEINSFAVKSAIDKNFDFAKNIGLKGAPSQIIKGNFVHGMIDADKYKMIFSEIRKMGNDKASDENNIKSTETENISKENSEAPINAEVPIEDEMPPKVGLPSQNDQPNVIDDKEKNLEAQDEPVTGAAPNDAAPADLVKSQTDPSSK